MRLSKIFLVVFSFLLVGCQQAVELLATGVVEHEVGTVIGETVGDVIFDDDTSSDQSSETSD